MALPLPQRLLTELGIRLCPNILICDHLLVIAGLRSVRLAVRRKPARHFHLKDCFARTAAEQDNLSTMLQCDAMSKSESETRSFLLALADKRLKETVANVIRDTGAVINDVDEDLTLLRL